MNQYKIFTSMNKQSGQVSRTLLVLAVVIFILAIGVYVFLQYGSNQRAIQKKAQEEAAKEEPKPVYEAQVGDVVFTFQAARNLGKVLKSPLKSGFQETAVTTERFIQVTVGAKNLGKVNMPSDSWKVGNLIDSEGRNFLPADNKAYFMLPKPNLCGTLLRPAFDPVPCVKIYEVSSESTDLKVQVSALLSPESSRKQSALLDIKF